VIASPEFGELIETMHAGRSKLTISLAGRIPDDHRDRFQFTVKLKLVVDDALVASELLSVKAFTVTV